MAHTTIIQPAGITAALRERIAARAERENSAASKAMGAQVTNAAVAAAMAGGCLAALALVLASDNIAEYGWAACSLMTAFRCWRNAIKDTNLHTNTTNNKAMKGGRK